MKTVGLITEYNPFHNGHLYHMQKAKEITGADRIVVVMSGDFTQRGTPAITDKFTRADMALSEGADLVLELPVIYSSGSAEYFALGAVSLLEKLGCIDFLCFGSECGDISSLQKVADFLQEEPFAYREALKEQLQKGLSYPAARTLALAAALPPSLNDLHDIVNEPNNILALEYLKALKTLHSPILPFTVKRTGAAYHDAALTTNFSSATALRKIMQKTPADISELKPQIPKNAFQILQNAVTLLPPAENNDFSDYLYYALLTKQDHLEDYLDADSDLAGRIRSFLPSYTTFTDFADLLKTKAYTHTRITRVLCHIMLDIKKSDSLDFRNNGIIFYAKALGFQRNAAPLLKSIKEKSSVPFLTKLSDAKNQLDKHGLNMLHFDIHASELYHGIHRKNGHTYNEYTTPLIFKNG